MTGPERRRTLESSATLMVLLRRARRWLAVAALGALAAGVAFELGLRWLLFGRGELASAWGRDLRRPGLFTDGGEDPAYFVLDLAFLPPELRLPAPGPDPLLGWRGFLDAAYQHPDRPLLRGRRPLLLYGDSYAQCATPPQECFQSLLEETPWAAELGLVNYGVGGYGLGQIWLLLRESLPLFAGERPVVAVGILIDSDLHRPILGLRCWSKPRFTTRAGELSIEPPLRDPDRWIEHYGPGVTSYAWRFLLHGSGLVPDSLGGALSGRAARGREQRAVTRAILAELHEELERSGVPYFFLLFNAEWSLRVPGAKDWEEVELHRTLTELGAPFVSTRPHLEAWVERNGGDDRPLFGQRGARRGHYSALGNRVALEALLEGLERVLGSEAGPVEAAAPR